MNNTQPPASSQPRPRPAHEARILIVIAALVVGAMVVAFVIYNNSEAGRTATATSPESVSGITPEDVAVELVRSDSPTLGPADAPVTLVEFLDPECESCRAAFPAVKALLQQYDGRLRFVVRYLPLHNNSVLAAAATEAAGRQGQYWEMQELLFERQTEWGEQRASQRDRMIAYAQELGLNMDQFTTDLDDADIRAKIERDRQDAAALGLRGTPSFFVNGQPVEPLSLDRLQEMIEAGLQS